jgi:hypothetical protein
VSQLRKLYEANMQPGRPPQVVFAGSRGWENAEMMAPRVNMLPRESTVIQGGAKGADEMAKYFAARRHDLYVVEVRPLWDVLGNRAGHARNDAMLRMLHPDHDWCEFFWDGKSPGTKGCIRAAERLGIPYNVHYADGRRGASAGRMSTAQLFDHTTAVGHAPPKVCACAPAGVDPCAEGLRCVHAAHCCAVRQENRLALQLGHCADCGAAPGEDCTDECASRGME